MKRFVPIPWLVLFFILLVIVFVSDAGRIADHRTFPLTTEGTGQFFAQRAYPNRTMPEQGYYQAWEKAQVERALGKRADWTSSGHWESIGPRNLGGRTIAIAVDPNHPDTVYAGSASGGLWRLTITGEGKYDYEWERIDTGYPVLGVKAIAVDPRDSDVIYIGTGEVYGYQFSFGSVHFRWCRGSYGIGILKTTDGGRSWTQSLDWTTNQLRGVLVIRIHPENSDIVLAGTSEGTYRSTNGGSTWQRVLDVLMAVDIAIDPVNPDNVYLSCGNFGTGGTGFYRSTDNGISWRKIHGTGLPEWNGKALLDICEAEPNVIYVDIASLESQVGLYRSTDYGESWGRVSDVDMAMYQGWYSHYIRVNPQDPDKLFWAGVICGVSEDGGDSWDVEDTMYGFVFDSTLAHGDHHAFDNHPVDPDLFYIGNDGGVNRTRDGGRTWQDLNLGYVTTQFYMGFSSSKTDSAFALGGMQDNGTAIYHGSAERWQTWAWMGDGTYTAIDPSNNDIVYTSSQVLGIVRATDRGIDWGSWTRISPIGEVGRPGEVVAFVAPYVLVNSDLMYAATSYLYKTTDQGAHWTVLNGGAPLNGDLISALAVSPMNPEIVYAATVPDFFQGGTAEVLVTIDGGDSWINITRNLPNRYFMDLMASPHQENEVIVTLSGFGSSHLFRTTIDANAWEDIGIGLPDVPANAVLIDPLNYRKIYVGNDLGVWVSEDDGYTWQMFMDGLPNALLVYDLSLSESNRKIRAVTHGNGIYERALIPIDDDVPPVLPTAFELLQNYPNPFNAGTTIPFQLPQSGVVSVRIHNIRGQVLRTLTEKRYGRGQHAVLWDGTDDQGRPVPSGTYIGVLSSGEEISGVRMSLVR